MTLEQSWDQYNAFLKSNRIKLTHCNGYSDVCKITEYRKYVGKDYLHIKCNNYDTSIYIKGKWNSIEFTWGDYRKIYKIAPGCWDKYNWRGSEVDYLQDALDWYQEVKSGNATYHKYVYLK